MMSIVIIEDDPMSRDLILSTLREIDEDVEVRAMLPSVQESIEYLQSNNSIDLILSDVRLSDGLSFEIFQRVTITSPIIFISAYDNYVVNAFEYSGIDYLLKPVSRTALAHSIKKYRNLQKHFLNNNTTIRQFVDNYFAPRRSRVIVKKGYSSISLMLSDVVLFYTERMVVYVIDNAGNKYLIDKNLNSLEEELDPKEFFRVNRQYIVNINYIQGYKSYERVKLILTLKKELDHLIIIGQEKAKAFRKWITEA